MTVVADELWIFMVTTAPTRQLLMVYGEHSQHRDAFYRRRFCKPSPIWCMQKINRAKPPNRAIIVEKPIIHTP
jgi:hypothetical protein